MTNMATNLRVNSDS